ncbi:nuclear transport factor 2 family protein [Dactylosporangium sp. CA-152071]|uniref:nuclear transport factor 2 family protein n=1 Tax=Dactylosporangium sp. CA-152071 TaxID=3239933 RepID=UPI003D94191E
MDIAASLTEALEAVTFADRGADEVTGLLVEAVVAWAEGQGWRTYRRAASVLPLPPPYERQRSVLDVACARPGGPPVVVEVDHGDRQRTVDKLAAEAAAGRVAIWVRWGTGRLAVPEGVCLVALPVTARAGLHGRGRLFSRVPDLPAPEHTAGGGSYTAEELGASGGSDTAQELGADSGSSTVEERGTGGGSSTVEERGEGGGSYTAKEAEQDPPAPERGAGGGSPTEEELDSDLALVLRAYAAFARGDIDGAVRDLAPDVDWVEPDEFPDGGHHRGPAAVAAYLRNSYDGWGELHSEPVAHRRGDQIVIVHRVWGALRDGTPASATVADVFTVEDGKVVLMMAYADPADAFR